MDETDHLRRELRIAPVMTGGTSLSVWMGGATVELYTMLREGEGAGGRGGERDGHAPSSVYRRLCELTRTTPVVDVITGTSAGGLNGTLLAAGVAYRVPQEAFSRLRTTWMEVADVAALLRDVDDEAVPVSLLDGQAKFRDEVAKVIGEWRDAVDREQLERPCFVDLVTTYTCVEPRERTTVDDFGEEMSEVRYAGTLRFTQDDFVDDGSSPGIVAKLAHAAKASASLPGVFEPSQLAWWSDGQDPYDPTHPDDPPNLIRNVVAESSASGSQYVVDGGVVVNMPLTEALERIYARPNSTLVRRVVLYVSPTPKAAVPTHARRRHEQCADPRVDDPASAAAGPAPDGSAPAPLLAPRLREAVLTVVTAPRAEGISTDLDDIEQHNRDVRQQRTTRSTLGWLLSDGRDPLEPGASTEAERELMALYVDARAEHSIASLFERLRPVLGGQGPADPKLLHEALVRARAGLLPTSISLHVLEDEGWTWGVAPLEESVSLLSSIVNRVLGLPLAGLSEELDAIDREETFRALAGCKQVLQGVAERCERIRRYDDAFWSMRIRALPSHHPGLDVEGFARSGFLVWPALDASESTEGRPVTRAEVLTGLRDGFRTVADVVSDVHRWVTPLLRAATGPGVRTDGRRGETQQEARALTRELAAIRSDASPELIAWALLRLHVLQTVMTGRRQRHEQRVEMLQVSWNTPDYVTGREPVRKLVGPELARLGAFLKPSWRANDFFWGRMDAAPRLIELLAEPRRLVQLGVSRERLCAELEVVADAALTEELAFLDNPGRSVPHRVPRLVEALSTRRQLEIAREELPHVAATIGVPHRASGLAVATPEQARRFAQAARVLDDGQPSDAEVETVLCSMRVGEENLQSEAGSQLLDHVVRSASLLALRAVLGPNSGFGVPRPVRTVARAVGRLTLGAVGGRLLRSFADRPAPGTYTCRALVATGSEVAR